MKQIREKVRKKGNLPIIESLEIVDIAAEGKAIGRWNDIVIFVPWAVVGDVVNVQINSKKRRFMEGYILDFVKRSPMRVEPFCQHYGVCGGCKWQNIPYQEQLLFKHKQVEDQLSRIGKIELPEISPIIGSAKSQYYRNKLEFTFSFKRWRTKEEMDIEVTDANALGFHIPGLFDKILDINYCYLQPSPSNEIRMAIRKFTTENDYEYYDVRNHAGYMRNIIIRTTSTGEVMLIVVFANADEKKQEALLSHIANEFPQITSLMYVINSKFNDTIGDLDIKLYKGRDHIIEQMEGLSFKIGPKSFYQTNSEQAYELYKIAREFAEIKPTDTVYDLYTGTGTIANFVARQASKVIGIEYVPEAIEDAKVNSQLNNITNTKFFAGDMKDVLSDQFIAQNGKADVIILDPPRAGIHDDVAQTILRAAPSRIVYVSCNPATQARDLALLDQKYRVTRVQPVDMFPHTHHVENVVQLIRR